MPFITEEIWQRLPHEGETICLAPFPQARPERRDPAALEQMSSLIAIITKIRNIRSEMNIPNGSWLTLYVTTEHAEARKVIAENMDHIKLLARVKEILIGGAAPQLAQAARDVVGDIEIAFPLENLIDFSKERERLSRELSRKEGEARALATRLDNHSFRERAPEEVVEQTRARHGQLIAEISKLRSTLQSIS
jgi:valyl-tRNA synthetase